MTMDPEVGRTSFVLRMLALAFVVGLMALLIYQNYWQTRQLAVRAKQLELEALQARIRPHFLFNTLNTGAALVHARPDEAERVLLDLADLFRAALRGPELIPLAEELALTRRYLEIEALRFGDRLRLHWEIPETMPEVLVPSLSIQPLAENAIRHGIERRPDGGAVDVAVRLFADRVEITVANDMPGIAGGGGGHAVGLASARERVRAFSDGRGDVDTRLLDGRHIATMTLPL
jgi:two-component system sensor histidine kinase AlgZ